MLKNVNISSKKTSILENLVGNWNLERLYDNGSKVIGTAHFTKHSATRFEYSEKGVMTLADGKKMTCARRYIYKPIADGFEVYFFENPTKLFQKIVLKKTNEVLCAEATHFCVKDMYSSSYKFFDDTYFEITHVVNGQKKDYTSKGLFKKIKI